MKNVLTIAGTDPSGAAGIQVDLQVFRDHGVYGLSCVTAVIAQNTSGVQEWVAVEPSLISRQLDSVFNDIEVDAVKIGMTPTSAAVDAIAEALRGRKIPIVIDPVLASGDGSTALVRDGTIEALAERLFPTATLVTPNAVEAAVLMGKTFEPTDTLDLLARELARTSLGDVLLKGGHGKSDVVVDYLITDGEVKPLRPYPRIPDDVRGTGCQLSSAIASRLADGDSVEDAVVGARAYLEDLLENRRAALGKGRPVIKRERPR